ncbi:MAG: transcription factor FapR [Synergistaceae bacterium]|nr:transcription factor FapR [Synergistaceae bacterium]
MQQAQKKVRQRRLLKLLEANPLMTDEDLARSLSVSVSTIRLDRALLNVPELRERMREMAEKASGPLSAMKRASLFGELLGLEPGQWGLSLLVPDIEMVSTEEGAIGGHYLFAQAATLALATVQQGSAWIESARLRFLRAVFAEERCIARSKVGTHKNGRSVVSVRTRVMDEDVFVARFILVTESEEPG